MLKKSFILSAGTFRLHSPAVLLGYERTGNTENVVLGAGGGFGKGHCNLFLFFYGKFNLKKDARYSCSLMIMKRQSLKKIITTAMHLSIKY